MSRPHTPLEQRFWPKVDKRGADECWLWLGARIPKGYGRILGSSKPVYAHRASWEIANDQSVPTGLVVMHSCDNPPCVNPAHLSVGTAGDNNRDAIAKGRNAFTQRTHCPRGHAYDAKNTYLRNGKHRVCRICTRAATVRWMQGKAALAKAVQP